MSQKISGKNLTYDTSLPPFLARLRGQAASNNDGPDPLLVRNRRHAKPRTGSEEAEDGPLILDEEGNAVSGLRVGVDGAVTETEEKGQVGSEEKDEDAAQTDEHGKVQEEQKEKTAGIGAGRKRKVGKVIGVDGDEEEEGDRTTIKGKVKTEEKKAKAKPKSQKAKGAKKAKLSFEDDEG